MITVSIYHRNESGADTSLMSYETEIIPVVGDVYAAHCFEDRYHRTVVERLLRTESPDSD